MIPPPDDAAVELAFDAEAMLQRDSRVLLDPSFLGTLHAELERELEPFEAEMALLQMGFLHGLQDVTRALAATAELRSDRAGRVLLPPLRMPYRALPEEGLRGELVLAGIWPDRHEATARRAALGASEAPVCGLSAGYTSGWLSGAFDADLLAVERRCCAASGASCRFEAREVESWLRRGDEAAERGLVALPFERLRTLVRQRFASGAGRAGLDREAAAVHIWGPVMVVPYGGPDETLQAIAMLTRDSGAAHVSVVVVDLGGAIIDEAFGALALEQLVQSADAWGLETLFADPSPLSEGVLRDLDHPPLMVVKDLEPAIALAFQIARSQRVVV